MDRLTSGLRPYLLLFFVCLAVYLPGISAVPPTDRDEARFVQATRQMLETGDFIDIRYQDDPRYQKPVGIYWMQAASVSVLSDPQERSIWAWRVVSVIGATGAVLTTFHLGALLFGRRAALVGALALAVSLVLAVEAHIAKTDAMLLFLVVVAQAALARTYISGRAAPAVDGGAAVPTDPPADRPPGAAEADRPPDGQTEMPPDTPADSVSADLQATVLPRRRPGNALTAAVFWVAIGVGVLVKGPIAPMVVGLTAITLAAVEWRWRWLLGLRLKWGPALALAIAAPWFVAIEIVSGGAFLAAAVGDDLLAKLTSGQGAGPLPPGFFLATISAAFWPASLFLWPALVGAVRRWRLPAIRFCAAWIMPTWLVFELVPTKLIHYTLPVVPALALIVGAAIAASDGPWPVLRHWLAKAWYVVWGVIGLVIGIGLVYASVQYVPGFAVQAVLSGIVAAAAAIGGTFLALWWLQRRELGRPLASALIGGAVTIMVTFGLLLPQLDRLWVSRDLADALSEADGVGPVALTGFREPSAVFMLGTDTVLDLTGRVAEHFRSRPGSLVGVEDRQSAAFLGAMAEHDVPFEVVGRIEGFNYARGWTVNISLYRNMADLVTDGADDADMPAETAPEGPPTQ